MNRIFIGLGGNVGDVIGSMVAALHGLDGHKDIWVIARSHLYRTPPWGDANQDDFINACAMLETGLQPIELLAVIKDLEKKLKRTKTRRWGPRTIDLDILLFGDVELDSATLEIPHPRMTERAFVLMPLADLDDQVLVRGKSVRHWLSQADLAGIARIEDQGGWVSGTSSHA